MTQDSNEDDVDPTLNIRLIRSLRYICHTRHDLAYIVGMVSRFMQKPKFSLLAPPRGY